MNVRNVLGLTFIGHSLNHSLILLYPVIMIRLADLHPELSLAQFGVIGKQATIDRHRLQRHTTARAIAGGILDNLRMHRAGVLTGNGGRRGCRFGVTV